MAAQVRRLAITLLCAVAMPALAQTGPPISTQTLSAKGRVGKISYEYDIKYPQFDGDAAVFSVLNTWFATKAKQAIGFAVPPKDYKPPDEQEWSYEQDFTLLRPSDRSVVVALEFGGYTGGAHPNGGKDCILVDLRTGRAAGPTEVFRPGDGWLAKLVPLVQAGLKQQFSDDRPGFPDALKPAALRKLLAEPSHYCWDKGKLTLNFDAYTVGPYVSGPFEVVLPTAKLSDVMNPDGPLGGGR